MSIVITRSGKGSNISAGENDTNLDSLCGINESQTDNYTVVAADQNRTIEVNKATAVTITLDDISTIIAAIDTSDFTVTIKNIGAGLVTINADGSDSFDNGASSYVLSRYESVTIQSDSTQAKWNAISDNTRGARTSFTPTIYGLTVAGTPTGSFSAWYTCSGPIVLYEFTISITGIGGMTGTLGLSGLPIPIVNNSANYQRIQMINCSGTAAGDIVNLHPNSTTSLSFTYSTPSDTSGPYALDVTDISTTAEIRGSVVFPRS